MYNELKQTLHFIIDKLEQTQLADKYRQLAQSYETARTNPSPEITLSINALKEEIKSLQSNIITDNFDELSYKVFKRIEHEDLLGYHANKYLFNQISSVGVDFQAAQNTINEFAGKLDNLHEKAKNILNNLESVFDDPQPLPEGYSKLQLIFENEVDLNNFHDLNIQSNDWDEILKITAQIYPDGKQPAHIYSLQKSSPAVIVIAGPETIMSIIATASLFAMKIKKDLLEIKRTQLEIEELKFSNGKKIIELLAAEEELKLNSSINKATQEFISNYTQKIIKDHIGTSENAFKMLLIKIYNFAVKGGKINVIPPKLDEDTDETKVKINVLTKEIQSLSLSLNSPKLQLAIANEIIREKTTVDNKPELLKKTKSPRI